MKKAVPALMGAALLLLTGCATEAPVPTTYPYSTQHKLKSAHHWDVIAKDVAEQIIAAMAKHNLAASPAIVTTKQPKAPFHEGFRNFLITHLVNLNQPVAIKDADVEVQIETQLVRHNSDRYASIPGELTALAAGIMVVRNAALRWRNNQQAAGIIGLAALADWGKGYATGLTKTEVIVTTSVLYRGQYRMRKTDVYYIEDEDGSLYEQMKQMKEWRVVG